MVTLTGSRKIHSLSLLLRIQIMLASKVAFGNWTQIPAPQLGVDDVRFYITLVSKLSFHNGERVFLFAAVSNAIVAIHQDAAIFPDNQRVPAPFLIETSVQVP